MKRTIYIAILFLSLQSCNKDEQITTSSNYPIDFHTSMDTRVLSTNTNNLNEFYVTSINDKNKIYFEQIKFFRSGNYFLSNPLYYWIPGDVNFYAYAPSSTKIDGTIDFNERKRAITNFKPNLDISQHVDIIYAEAKGNKTNNEVNGVPLSFKHILSQINIKAKSSSKTYKYTVYGIKIGKVLPMGTYDFINKRWTIANNEKVSYSSTYSTGIALTSEEKDIMKSQDDNAMLIPQQLTAWNTCDPVNGGKGSYIAVLVNIKTVDGFQVYPCKAISPLYDWAAIPIGTKLEAGYKYTYVLDFSCGAGYVDPEKPHPSSGAVDPFNPGEKIFGGNIKIKEEVSQWINYSTDATYIDVGKK